MAELSVINLTFGYENSPENVFEDVSFSVDTNWKLGFIGRNGKGKTTFLNLLLGKYPYQGLIRCGEAFDYFPFAVTEAQKKEPLSLFMEDLASGVEDWRVMIEMRKLGLDTSLLYRPFGLLSNGEQTKSLLALLFSRENFFLLIDEPTNHLDAASRETVKEYLKEKKGFILVSHDRDLLDACIDHVLVLQRSTIRVEQGNFTSWWENKEKIDSFNRSENEKHQKEIGKLAATARRTANWAEQSEGSKIGFDPRKDPDRNVGTRSYIGAKTKKAEARVKAFEKRIDREIAEKEGLLQDLEETEKLELRPQHYFKARLIYAKEYGLSYRGTDEPVIRSLDFELHDGERIALQGENGCGKSSFIKAILRRIPGIRERHPAYLELFTENAEERGTLEVGSGLTVSYINQDTGFLQGSMEDFIRREGIDGTVFRAILRKLDFEREQFTKDLRELSEGQKKKILIAASLVTPAHLYIWDEPLNYIDVFSRLQIEELLLRFRPTMIFVEHDVKFTEKIAERIVRM